MIRRRAAQAPPSVDRDLVGEVTAEARARAGSWFPELDADGVDVRLLSSTARARCFLHRFELDDGRVRRPVMVKVRHSDPRLRRLDRFQGRPVLNPERTMSDEETARREYDGLCAIVDALGQPDDRFGLLRPLAWLPERSAIVMDVVDQPTLRQRLLETSRTRRSRQPVMAESAWCNAGRWLRVFHDHPLGLDLPSRTSSRDQVVDLYRAYGEFLGQRTGAASSGVRLDHRRIDLIAQALPSELPLAPGHGDFVANNMFADPTGRVTGFDPLPRWRVPRYQDLGTLTVGIRVLPVQAATQGLALAQDDLARYETALWRGYFGSEPVPLAAVRAYQLLVLLDKWSDLVSKRIPHGVVRPRLHELRVQVASRHFRSEVNRLVTALTDS